MNAHITGRSQSPFAASIRSSARLQSAQVGTRSSAKLDTFTSSPATSRALTRTFRSSQATDQATLIKFWNAYAPYYRKLNESPVYQGLMHDVLRECAVKSGHVCVDFGCGVGNFLPEIAQAGGKVIGIERSESMLAGARENLARRKLQVGEGEQVQLIQGGPEALKDIPGASADVFLMSLVLSYLDDYHVVLDEAFRILKPGGRLVMSNPVDNVNFTKVFTKSYAIALRHPIKNRKELWKLIGLLGHALAILKFAKQIEDFEQRGIFRFWDQDNTRTILAQAGFPSAEALITRSFANQAYVTSVKKPSPVTT